jgi:hypothetical protein
MNNRRNLIDNGKTSKGRSMFSGSKSKRTKRRSKNRDEDPMAMLKKGAFSSNMGHFTTKYSTSAKGVSKKTRAGDRASKPEEALQVPEAELDNAEEEPDNEFMAKLSMLTGKFSSMDYVPKNKLLKKQYAKDKKEKDLEIQEVDEDAFEETERSYRSPVGQNKKTFLQGEDVENVKIAPQSKGSPWDSKYKSIRSK